VPCGLAGQLHRLLDCRERGHVAVATFDLAPREQPSRQSIISCLRGAGNFEFNEDITNSRVRALGLKRCEVLCADYFGSHYLAVIATLAFNIL